MVKEGTPGSRAGTGMRSQTTLIRMRASCSSACWPHSRRESGSKTHHPPRLEWDSPGAPRQQRASQYPAESCGHLSLTLLGQPQEQHVAFRALSPAGGWSHFELVVLAPEEASKLRTLPAGQQGLCPWSSRASWGRLDPEQGCVGLSRCGRAAYLGDSPEEGWESRGFMTSSSLSSGQAPTPRSWALPSS